MAGLLVSVRSAAEAALAAEAGVDLIDVKEPRAGSLGAASTETIQAVVDTVSGRAPLSAACGELAQLGDRWRLAAPVEYAKFGLAGCASLADWPARWRSALARLPAAARPVAVVYADWRTCRAPAPGDVIAAAIDQECAALLLDTFDKSHGNLFAHLSPEELTDTIARARGAGLRIVLAGSLDSCSLPIALDYEPDLVAVRGCVCAAGRDSDLDRRKVDDVVTLVHGHSIGSAP